MRGPSAKMRAATVPKESTRTLFNGYEALRRTNIFNLRHKAHLRYHTDIDLGVQGATPTAYVFSANGLYDPDITSTGHQPMGFDQMMSFFQHYAVTNSRISVLFQNNISDGGAMVYGGVAIQRTTSALSVWDRIVEAGNFAYAPLTGITPGGGPPPVIIRSGVRTSDFFSVPNILNDDTLKGTASANPSSQVYFVIYAVVPWAGGPSTNHLQAGVTIEFDAEFTEPLQPIES